MTGPLLTLAALTSWLCGPNVPIKNGCGSMFDLNASGTVDLRDFAEWQNRVNWCDEMHGCGVIKEATP